MRVGWCSTSLRDEIMRAEQVLSRSNLGVKVNYVSKCQQKSAIKTRPHLSKFPIKTPIPGPVPGPLVCEYVMSNADSPRTRRGERGTRVVLSAGPRDALSRVGRAFHHQLRVARLRPPPSPRVPRLRSTPRHPPSPPPPNPQTERREPRLDVHFNLPVAAFSRASRRSASIESNASSIASSSASSSSHASSHASPHSSSWSIGSSFSSSGGSTRASTTTTEVAAAAATFLAASSSDPPTTRSDPPWPRTWRRWTWRAVFFPAHFFSPDASVDHEFCAKPSGTATRASPPGFARRARRAARRRQSPRPRPRVHRRSFLSVPPRSAR